MLQNYAKEYQKYFENSANEKKTLINYFSWFFHAATITDIINKYGEDNEKMIFMLKRSERVTRLIVLYLISKHRKEVNK